MNIRTLGLLALGLLAAGCAGNGYERRADEAAATGGGAAKVIDCATGQEVAKPAHDGEDPALAHVHGVLDHYVCYVAPDNVPLLLLRAQLVVAVVGRYGAASIERYAENRDEAAARVMARLNDTEHALARAVEAYNQGPAGFYEVYRATLVLESARLINTASKPTRSELLGAFTGGFNLGFARKAFDLLRNLLVDELYKAAYRDGFVSLVKSMDGKPPSPEHWAAVAALFNDEDGPCPRLQELQARGSRTACALLPAGTVPVAASH